MPCQHFSPYSPPIAPPKGRAIHPRLERSGLSGSFTVIWGWFLIPFNLMQLFVGQGALVHPIVGGGFAAPAWVLWANWGVVLYYVLFLTFFGWCAYRAAQRTGSVKNGLFNVLWAMFVMLFSAIIPATITLMWGQNTSFAFFVSSLGSAVEMDVLFLVPCCVMALLIGFVGIELGRRSFKNRQLAHMAA